MPAVVSYKYPNTAAPSVGTFSMLVAEVVYTDLDTSAAITHAFGLAAGNPSGDLTSDFPIVVWAFKTAPTTSVAALFSVALTDSSTVTITKVAAVGSLATIIVWIMRPHTFIR